MRILIDECLDWRLGRTLTGNDWTEEVARQLKRLLG
jgi:predicted nuclease of predicted toxin-antitoxin system